MTDLDVEFIESDVSGSDEDFLDERIETLEDCEIEEPRTVLIHIWRDQLPVLRHLFLNLGEEMVRSGLASNRKNPRDSDLRKAQIWGLEKKAGPRAIGELTRSLSLGKKKDMGVFGNSLRPFLLSLGFVWAQTPSPSGLKF